MAEELALSAGRAGGGGAGSPIGLCRVSLSIKLVWAPSASAIFFDFVASKARGTFDSLASAANLLGETEEVFETCCHHLKRSLGPNAVASWFPLVLQRAHGIWNS